MSSRNPLPHNWTVPEVFRNRLGESAGAQRAMLAEGHLLIVLHEPPQSDEADRTGRLFWRNPAGEWKSNSLGNGIQALKKHLAEFVERTAELEKAECAAQHAADYFRVLKGVAPLRRTARNQGVALQQAREMVPGDRDLISCRDEAQNIERMAELTQADAQTGLNYHIARQAEEQNRSSHEMARAGHRLNELAAFFLPLATVSSLFGMQLRNGLEGMAPAIFWVILVVGFVGGAILKTAVLSRGNIPAGLEKRKGF